MTEHTNTWRGTAMTGRKQPYPAALKIGAVVIGYGVALNLLVFLLPDSRGAWIAGGVGIVLLLICLYFTVRAVLRNHLHRKHDSH